MAKLLAKYETVFIIAPTLSEEDAAAVIEKFRALAEQYAEPDTVVADDWGKRRLAYEINDFTEGYYALISFTSKPDFPAELDRVFKITDSIIRSLIVCKDE
ncbi:MAG: 30S ribosomal protein S6 [Oscillospiraceae bacterium]|jgi:small subunit ribosomal protein S6|nr:30S ribosomal protein S6 [Oscillospiraceae bacterium]